MIRLTTNISIACIAQVTPTLVLPLMAVFCLAFSIGLQWTYQCFYNRVVQFRRLLLRMRHFIIMATRNTAPIKADTVQLSDTTEEILGRCGCLRKQDCWHWTQFLFLFHLPRRRRLSPFLRWAFRL